MIYEAEIPEIPALHLQGDRCQSGANPDGPWRPCRRNDPHEGTETDLPGTGKRREFRNISGKPGTHPVPAGPSPGGARPCRRGVPAGIEPRVRGSGETDITDTGAGPESWVR